MLLSDFLVALPGMVTPVGTAPQAEDISIQSAAQQISAQSTIAGTTTTQSTPAPKPTSLSFMNQALLDFQKKVGYTPPATPTNPQPETPQPQPETPQPETPQPQPETPAPSQPEVPQPSNPVTPDPVTPDPVTPDPVVPTPEPVEAPSLPMRTDTLKAEAGRVLTIETHGSDEIASVRMLSQTGHGNVSVNPDNDLSLVFSESPRNQEDTSFRYEITYKNGSTQEVHALVDMTVGSEPDGWGLGDVYMLETGNDGLAVVEHGENHRKVYITEGIHGLTREEIAKAEGIAVSKVTKKWLVEHSEYGATADKALDTSIGMELWYATTGRAVAPNSNWLLFERGYEYDNIGRVVNRGTSGESALNPTYIGAYGQGDDPLLDTVINVYQNQVSHVVIQGIDTTSVNVLLGENLLFDHVSLSGNDMTIQNAKNFSLVDSDIVDVARTQPVQKGAIWDPGPNRISGAYLSNVDGAYLEGNLFDHNGWAEGFDPKMSSSKPQPPSKFSHNLYVQNDNLDVTIRDNIFMRGASFGAQMRSGGLIEDNSFIDNNAALNVLSGQNYALALGNVVTSAGYVSLAKPDGALSMGIDNHGKKMSLIDNIVAHLADPNNAQEQAKKPTAHSPLTKTDGYYNDTIVYNWGNPRKSTNQNIDGLNKAVLNETTIQKFTAQLLGNDNAKISDLANLLRNQADGKLDTAVNADVINAFFQKGFGLATTLRGDAETVRFIPDDRGEGMRWDSRLNWSTNDLPGTQDGDSVDLSGNRVLFGVETVAVDDFIFGDFGQLKATSGRLDITGDIATSMTGNLLQIDNAAQVWIDGYRDSDLLAIEMQGGRLANVGDVVGSTATKASEDAQLILASNGGRFDLTTGSSLTVTGSKAKVGFDGTDGKTATLQMHDGSLLSFVSNGTGLGKISEFSSGAYTNADVTSGISLDGDLSIDLSWMSRYSGGTWTLIDADQIIGQFDNINVSGLGKSRDALIRVDYVRDEVVLLISDFGKGSGEVKATTNGDADFIDYTNDGALKTLWADLHAAMPAPTDDPI